MRDAEEVGDLGGEQAAGAAERDHGVVAGVAPARRRHLADAEHLVRRRDLQRARGHLLRRHAEPLAELGIGGARRLEVELDLAADQRRRQAAEHDCRIGDGRLRAALADSRSGPGSAPALCGPTLRLP